MREANWTGLLSKEGFLNFLKLLQIFENFLAPPIPSSNPAQRACMHVYAVNQSRRCSCNHANTVSLLKEAASDAVAPASLHPTSAVTLVVRVLTVLVWMVTSTLRLLLALTQLLTVGLVDELDGVRLVASDGLAIATAAGLATGVARGALVAESAREPGRAVAAFHL